MTERSELTIFQTHLNGQAWIMKMIEELTRDLFDLLL